MPRVDKLIESLGDAQFITTARLIEGVLPGPRRRGRQRQDCLHDARWEILFHQRLMDRILSDCHGYAAANLDDIVIHSKSWSIHIRDVFKRPALKD